MPEPIHVFIDTNIWLSFYSFTNDDVEQLRKLVALIKSGKLKLYLDQHLADEFYRNREKKLEESIREFSKASVPKGMPRYMRDYPEAEEYAKNVEAADKLRDALITRAKEDARAKALAADKLFAELIEASPPSKADANVFNAALNRRLKGNPPGKYPSMGDQIHWEALLRDVPDGADLHVVSKDGDFESVLIKGTAHPFLVDEWKAEKNGDLWLHNELRPFFNSKFPAIKLAVDVEKNAATARLVTSGSFLETHNAISGLALFKNDLSWEDADALFKAGLDNTQIKWIGSDKDVREFYRPLIEKFKHQLGQERAGALAAVFKEEEPIDWGSPDPDESPPF